MFFCIPLTHDRTVYGLPVVTLGIIAACTVVWVATLAIEVPVGEELAGLEQEIGAIVEKFPDARVPYHVEGLPHEVREAVFDPLVDEDPERPPQPGDTELDGAMRRVVDALNRLPTVRLGYRPAAPDIGALFGNMWAHAGFGHLFGNMLFLFVAGTVIESRFTRSRFLLYYVAAGLFATFVHGFVEYRSMTPLVGASGAISGVLATAFVLHPRTRITFGYLVFLFRIWRGTFQIPAWVCIPAWGAMQIIDAVASNGEPVAYFAHVGGFAFGLVAALVLHRMGLLEDDIDNLGQTEFVRPT